MNNIKIKPIKLSNKRAGDGYISSYTINIGATEARACGFINSENEKIPIEKIIDEENNQIIIRLIKN